MPKKVVKKKEPTRVKAKSSPVTRTESRKAQSRQRQLPEIENEVADQSHQKPAVKRTAKAARSTEPASVPVQAKAEKPILADNSHPKHSLANRIKQARDIGTDNAPHLIIEARAGTGKTTTLVEGLKRVQGLPSSLIPSPQQEAVWEAMEMSKGRAQSINFVAFNKSIAAELQRRIPEGCSAQTMHSMGNGAVSRAYGRVQLNGDRVGDIISELYGGRDIRELRKYKMPLLKAVQSLVGLCKQNLTRLDGSDWREELNKLVSHYDVEVEDHEVYDLVPKVMERSLDVTKDGCMDFNDMIWLPIAANLPLQKYDILLVDEAQDLNRCQQELALRAGRRLILCGDPKQAIYGFAGADADSMPRMAKTLGATDRGCDVLPLTVTRRCGKAIVKEAQKIVPDFEAFETNPEGLVITGLTYVDDQKAAKDGAAQKNYRGYVEDGDMVLCRVNAPLISQCFKFIKAGRKANIQGRDIVAGLIKTVKRLNAGSVPDLVGKLSDWKHAEIQKENAKRIPSDSRLIAIQDRYDCLMCFTEEALSVDEVLGKIDRIFTDNQEAEGIKLSSVHKAKGLEAKRVFILTPEGAAMPHPMAKSAWQKEQESHILYVAITRARDELIYVS